LRATVYLALGQVKLGEVSVSARRRARRHGRSRRIPEERSGEAGSHDKPLLPCRGKWRRRESNPRCRNSQFLVNAGAGPRAVTSTAWARLSPAPKTTRRELSRRQKSAYCFPQGGSTPRSRRLESSSGRGNGIRLSRTGASLYRRAVSCGVGRRQRKEADSRLRDG
jgi:hypothetical protein